MKVMSLAEAQMHVHRPGTLNTSTIIMPLQVTSLHGIQPLRIRMQRSIQAVDGGFSRARHGESPRANL